jgi:predicted AAA+ superfamily ATPase
MEKKSLYLLEEIFTPSQPAKLTFIERKSVKTRLQRALKIPGRQIVVYGYSGAGKTTLLLNKLDAWGYKRIVTSCIKGMTINEIIVDAFDQLNIYFYRKERR